MAGKRSRRYEEIPAMVRVPRGSRATPSKKSPGSNSALFHGRKGVSGQITWTPIKNATKAAADAAAPQRKSSFLRTLGAYLGKMLMTLSFVIAFVVGVIALVVAVVRAVGLAISDAFAEVGEALTTDAALTGIGVTAAVLLLAVGARPMFRALTRARASSAHRTAQFEAQRTWASAAAPPPPVVRGCHATPPPVARQVPAGWMPDRVNPAYLRYWDGTRWTDHIQPCQPARAPGWYPAPENPYQMQFWNGTAWTPHVVPKVVQPAPTPHRSSIPDRSAAPPRDSSITMSSAEWQEHVRLWMASGAVHQEMWRRLTSARISDADQPTLDAQRRMKELTPEQGSERLQLLLGSNPRLLDELGVADLFAYLIHNLAPVEAPRPEGISHDRG